MVVVAGAMTPLSQLYYGAMLDEMNREYVDSESMKRIFFACSLILLLSAIFSFFERYFLGYFAGECY